MEATLNFPLESENSDLQFAGNQQFLKINLPAKYSIRFNLTIIYAD